MKKVMIGILILIPIIVLLVIVAVGAIISMDAYISVESVSLEDADGNKVKTLTISTSELEGGVLDITKQVYVKVYPAKATDKTVSWSIEDLRCLDAEYDEAVNGAAAVLIDRQGRESQTNETGKVAIRTYCQFVLKVSAGFHSASVKVSIIGYDVEKISLANVTTENNHLVVGEVLRLSANYTPVDSIVSEVEWLSDNAQVASVDTNGVVTAHKPGVAHITHKADIYSKENEYLSSNPFEIVVDAGASTLYGNTLTTSKTLLSLHELGLGDGYQVVGDGATIVGDDLTISGDTVVLSNGTKTFTIARCEDKAIEIVNKQLFDNRDERNNYILEVGSARTFILEARWASQTETATLTDVVWTSSNPQIATVDSNGAVRALSDGIVTITATREGKSANIELNVREKVTTLRLETSNSHFASVGLARETVFASERYVNIDVDHTKEANSVLIVVEGEPEDERLLVDFYNKYNFEIVSGEDYAHFDDTTANKLVFDSEELEGKGRQEVTVRVSAKYPKYETLTHYTTEEVTLDVVYGVEVATPVEFKEAGNDQKEYAYANKVATKDYHGFDIYISSSKTMAIAIVNDFEFDPEYCRRYHDSGKFCWDTRVLLYGDVYGNGHTLSCKKEYIDDQYRELTRICWSNVTMSNLHIRVNTLAEDESSFDTQGLWGDCVDIEANEDESMNIKHGSARLTNVRIEFCWLENGKKVSSIYNSDVTYDGCVFRNVAQSAFYSPTRFRNLTMPDGNEYLYPEYVHYYFNNIFATNLLGTLANITYDYYSVDHYDSMNQPTYRFGQTAETIDQYMYDNYISKGYNSELIQTGFLDLYNWQPSSATNMLKTGNDDADKLLQTALGALVDKHPDLDQFKYIWKRNGIDESYFHMGFVAVGINTPNGFPPASETIYLKPQLEDKRFTYFFSKNLRSIKEIREQDPSFKNDTVLATTVTMLKKMDFYIWLYDNKCNINPETQDPESGSMPNGARLIDHLHGLV